ncbi:Crp/Fnr family transcriptional regulator [Roseovarius rhodophyticola]|uniref:Crp/Fnr family transcriptional regulator n=1 Tax=Roseovarius rhodophyticola TaxID=3080827 RepID=A0ABZ2TDM3_9RHOB|nr:Crp/Fnr family transcriptional regulator [Roseovarius sp. W115]MDV2927981.1 Crp/Fnr family transcriptional regulator [Roseovarius sp. W115]
MTWTAHAFGLEHLDPDTQDHLHHLAPVLLPEGAALFHPGDTAEGFVIMLSGRVDVFLTGPTGRDILLYTVEPGQSCVQTTLGLLGGEAYSGEAIVRDKAELVLVPRALFLKLLQGSESFRGFVFSAFAARMQSMMHLLEKVAFQRVEARLAECLLARAQAGVLHSTHAEIATIIGTAREVISRRLEALDRRGILKLERGLVRILDADALKEIARTQ